MAEMTREEAFAKFMKSGQTMTQFADEHNLSFRTVSRWSKEMGGWFERREQMRAEAADLAVDRIKLDLSAEMAKESVRGLKAAEALYAAAHKILDAGIEKGAELSSVAQAAAKAQQMARLSLGMTTVNTGQADPADGVLTDEQKKAAVLEAAKFWQGKEQEAVH